MKRYHQELERTKRVHKRHLYGAHKQTGLINCVCEFQIGRFHKRKALGCYKTRCLLCHYEKIFAIASVKDRIREQRFLDSLKDYFDSKDRS